MGAYQSEDPANQREALRLGAVEMVEAALHRLAAPLLAAEDGGRLGRALEALWWACAPCAPLQDRVARCLLVNLPLWAADTPLALQAGGGEERRAEAAV